MNARSDTLPNMNETTGKTGLLAVVTGHGSARSSALLAMGAGLLLAAALPPCRGFFWLAPVALAVLFAQMHHSDHPGRLAWLFGLIHQSALLHWLFFLVPAKTIPFAALAQIQALATIFYVSAFYAIMGWLWGRLRRLTGPTWALPVLPVFWVGLEVWRGWGELGFPWCLSGSAVLNSPLMPLLRTSGEIGMSALWAFLAVVLLAQVGRELTSRVRILTGAFTGILWLGALLGIWWEPSLPGDQSVRPTPTLKVAAIQANVSLADKWEAAKIDSTRLPYRELTLAAADSGAQFVVWAETALPAYLLLKDIPLLNWTRRVIQDSGVFLYTGFPDAWKNLDGQTERFNSSGLFDPTGTLIDKYAKYHLLPIGESMPFTSLFPALAQVDVGQAEWTPGQPPQAMSITTPDGDFAFSGLICFESVFGGLARRSVLEGSGCLVVLTNDGWFGETAGPRQHTDLARLRAVECGVPLVRCANNGISLICDDRGRVSDQLGLGQRGFVQADVTAGTGRTLYVRWGTGPLWLLLMGWLVVLAVFCWRESRYS